MRWLLMGLSLLQTLSLTSLVTVRSSLTHLGVNPGGGERMPLSNTLAIGR